MLTHGRAGIASSVGRARAGVLTLRAVWAAAPEVCWNREQCGPSAAGRADFASSVGPTSTLVAIPARAAPACPHWSLSQHAQALIAHTGRDSSAPERLSPTLFMAVNWHCSTVVDTAATEGAVGTVHDTKRIDYIREHATSMSRAVNEGT